MPMAISEKQSTENKLTFPRAGWLAGGSEKLDFSIFSWINDKDAEGNADKADCGNRRVSIAKFRLNTVCGNRYGMASDSRKCAEKGFQGV